MLHIRVISLLLLFTIAHFFSFHYSLLFVTAKTRVYLLSLGKCQVCQSLLMLAKYESKTLL